MTTYVIVSFNVLKEVNTITKYGLKYNTLKDAASEK